MSSGKRNYGRIYFYPSHVTAVPADAIWVQEQAREMYLHCSEEEFECPV